MQPRENILVVFGRLQSNTRKWYDYIKQLDLKSSGYCGLCMLLKLFLGSQIPEIEN